MRSCIHLTGLASAVAAVLILASCQGRANPDPGNSLRGDSDRVDSEAAESAGSGGTASYMGRIVFASSDGAVRSVRPDGADQVVIAQPGSGVTGGGFQGAYTWPVWSPDASAVLLSRVVPEGGRRLRASLVRASALGGNEPVVIYQDDPGSFGIGTGVPHYAVWSPDGNLIALVAGGGSGLVTMFVDPAARRVPDVFVGGQPMFLAWAPNSRHLLVHHGDSLRLVEFGDGGQRTGGSLGIGEDSFEYLAPQFAPDGNRYAFAEPAGTGSLIKIGRLGAVDSGVLTESAAQIAFRWSPDGGRIAVAEGEDQRIFERLAIVDTATGARNVLVERPIHSFWWSPDSTRIALASLAGGGLDALAWSVVELSTGRETDLGVNVPTAEFQFMQTFFDQYAHSHEIWSPDSRAIVVFGSMLGAPEAGQDADLDTPETGAHAWVLDASGGRPPTAVGDGYIGAWSPR